MIVTVDRLDRVYDRAAVAALITPKQITGEGWDDEGRFWVRTDVNLTAAETDAVVRRLSTGSSIEETLYERGAAALDTDRNFRDNTVAQLVAGADAIIATPTVNQANIRELARGIKSLANQCDALTRQNIGLIRLAQNLLDSTD